MTKLKEYNLGGWVDETAPDVSGLDPRIPPEFSVWLSRRLGEYRSRKDFQDKLPPRDEVITALSKLEEFFWQASEISVRSFPPFASALLAEIALKDNHTNIHKLLGDFKQASIALRTYTLFVLTIIERSEPKRGRKKEILRDYLMQEICTKLQEYGLPRVRAMEVANAILIEAGGVTAPAGKNSDYEVKLAAAKRSLTKAVFVNKDVRKLKQRV